MDTMKLPDFFRKMLAYRRRQRVDFFLSHVCRKANMKVIDIGCGIDGRSFEDYVPCDWEIIGIDLHEKDRIGHKHPKFSYLKQDAMDLGQFGTGEFDLAVSVGMLEHITEDDAFKKISSEIQRVAKQYVVVVPYRYCWLEPHYGVPFSPLLPYPVQVGLVKTFNLSNQKARVTIDSEYIRNNYRWRSNAEYQGIFTDATIVLSPTWETIAILKAASLS